MRKKLKISERKRATTCSQLPRHRAFVGFVFVAVVLVVLSFSAFTSGYATGRTEAFAITTSLLSDIEVRWEKLRSRGIVPHGPVTAYRITGTVRAIAPSILSLDADPVSFELFSNESRLRTVSFSSTTSFVDIAADGSVVIPRQPLTIGERIAVIANQDIRTAEKIAAVRIERYR